MSVWRARQRKGDEQSTGDSVAFKRGKKPKGNILIYGIRLVFFTPRLEQDRGKSLLAIVLEE